MVEFTASLICTWGRTMAHTDDTMRHCGRKSVIVWQCKIRHGIPISSDLFLIIRIIVLFAPIARGAVGRMHHTLGASTIVTIYLCGPLCLNVVTAFGVRGSFTRRTKQIIWMSKGLGGEKAEAGHGTFVDGTLFRSVCVNRRRKWWWD